MRTARLIKIACVILAFIGTILSGLFFYFLNSLKNSNCELKRQICKLNDKLDELKQKYFQDLAGFGKIFAFKEQLNKSQQMLLKRIERLEDAPKK